MSYDTKEEINDRGKQLADEHVDWFLGVLKPLLKDHLAHGFKHGVTEALMERPLSGHVKASVMDEW